MQQRIAVIGLGAMGGAMAATLHTSGWSVTGFDPSPAAREAAAALGIRAVDALEGIGEVDYAVLSLPNAALVRSTVPALLAGGVTGGIVDTTTSEPATSRAMSELAEATGSAFVDAPVSGGRAGAATGKLSAFVGGTDRAVAAVTPALQALTSGQFQHLGAAGAGNVVKLINNALAAVNLATVGEALAVAKAWGVDPAAAAAGVSGASGASKVSAAMYPDWVLSGTHDSGFSMGLMARDVSLAMDIAAEVGETPELLRASSALWQRSLAELGATADFTEIARTVAPAVTNQAQSRGDAAENTQE